MALTQINSGNGSGNAAESHPASRPSVRGRPFQAGNQASKGPKNRLPAADAIRQAVERQAKKGVMQAVQVYLAYYAGLSARDSGPTLSERVQRILSDPDCRAAMVALDDKYIVEGQP